MLPPLEEREDELAEELEFAEEREAELLAEELDELELPRADGLALLPRAVGPPPKYDLTEPAEFARATTTSLGWAFAKVDSRMVKACIL